MYIVGIDPGLTGAVVIINEKGEVYSIFDTPIVEVQKTKKKKKKEYMPLEMAKLLRYDWDDKVHVFIEKVNAMPGQGVTSMFGFGKGFGLWLGIIAALELPMTLVTPQSWKKELMKGISDKDASRIRAQELFPSKVSELSRKKDIGRSDALLIAEYGRRVLSGSVKPPKNK